MKWGHKRSPTEGEADQGPPYKAAVKESPWPTPRRAVRRSWRIRPGSQDPATPVFGVTWRMTGCGTFAVDIWSCSVGKKWDQVGTPILGPVAGAGVGRS